MKWATVISLCFESWSFFGVLTKGSLSKFQLMNLFMFDKLPHKKCYGCGPVWDRIKQKKCVIKASQQWVLSSVGMSVY